MCKKNAKLLLNKMNQGTKYQENEAGTSFTSYILSSLKMDDKIKFIDDRNLIATAKDPEKYPEICTLEMGKTMLQFNSSNGEILNYKKSLFKTWSAIYSQAERYLKTFAEEFNNSEIVKKGFFGIAGFTQKGLKQLHETGYYNYYNRKV